MLAARRKGGERFFISSLPLKLYVWSESEDENAEEA